MSINVTNRNHKCRGQRVDTKEWVYGYYFEKPYKQTAEMTPYIIDVRKEFDNESLETVYSSYLWEVIPGTVGRYTGKVDARKNEIYEGDIIVWAPNQDGIWPGQTTPTTVTFPFICGNADLGHVVGTIYAHSEGGTK